MLVMLAMLIALALASGGGYFAMLRAQVGLADAF